MFVTFVEYKDKDPLRTVGGGWIQIIYQYQKKWWMCLNTFNLSVFNRLRSVSQAHGAQILLWANSETQSNCTLPWRVPCGLPWWSLWAPSCADWRRLWSRWAVQQNKCGTGTNVLKQYCHFLTMVLVQSTDCRGETLFIMVMVKLY